MHYNTVNACIAAECWARMRKLYSVITQVIPICWIYIVNKICINMIFRLFTNSSKKSPRVNLYPNSSICVNLWYASFVHNSNLSYWNELSDHTVKTNLIEAIEIIKFQKIHLKCSAIPFLLLFCFCSHF